MKKYFLFILISVFIIAIVNLPSVNAGTCTGTYCFLVDPDGWCGEWHDCSDFTTQAECDAESACTWNFNNPNSCTDSDGGAAYLTPGHISGYLSDNPYLVRDSCSGNTLTERTCSGAYQSSTNHDCTLGRICVDDIDASCQCPRCYYFNTTLNMCVDNYYCEDSDGGSNPYVGGATSGCLLGGDYTAGSDSCVDSNTVEEYYCAGGTKSLFTHISCPTRSSCVDVAPNPIDEFFAYCSCEDPNYPVYSNVTDACEECIADSDCAGGTSSYFVDYTGACTGTYTCEECTSSSQCTAGTNGDGIDYTGVCILNTCQQCDVDTDCDGSAVCNAGICEIPTIPDSCTDTPADVPVNYSYQGTVSGYITGSSYSISDYCDFQGFLKEYYCNTSTSYTVDTVDCGAGYLCENGACPTDPLCPVGGDDEFAGCYTSNPGNASLVVGMNYYCSSGSCYQCDPGYQWSDIEGCKPIEATCNEDPNNPEYLSADGSRYCCPDCLEYGYEWWHGVTWFP